MADSMIDIVVECQMNESHDLIREIREAPIEKFNQIKEEYIKLLEHAMEELPEDGTPRTAYNDLMENISEITQDYIVGDICEACYIWQVLLHSLWLIAESRQHEGVTVDLNNQRFRSTGKRILRKHLRNFHPEARGHTDCNSNQILRGRR
jgi:hypothetical protein